MPKRKTEEAPEEQVARFRREVQRLIDAGELNPTEADEQFDRLVGQLSSAGSGKAP